MAAVATSPQSDVDVKVETKPTLTPPASGESDKHDGSSSELSDLELEDDDNGEIVPDHYYEGGKVPVFKPVGPVRSQPSFGETIIIFQHIASCALEAGSSH